MRVALIHTPYYHQKHMDNVDFVSDNFGTLPPLGLMYVSSILKNAGHEVRIMDVKAEKLSKKQLAKKLREFEPDIVGIMIIPFTARIALEWAEYIKKELKVPIIAGNYGMLYYPEAVLSHDFIDFGIIGSARKSLPKLLELLENGNACNEELKKIENIAFKDGDGKIIVNYPKKITEDLNKLPWPDRESIDNRKYHSMASKHKPFTLIISSYGCPYQCSFCDMGRFGYSARNPKDVVDEIEYCVKKLGIKEFDMFDRDFLVNRKLAEGICREMIKRNIRVRWCCRARIDEIDEEILILLRKAGCRLILYGIESGDEEILKRIRKPFTLKEIERTIRLTKRFGIGALGFFIIGLPGETVKTIRKTISLAKKLPLDYAQFFKMTGKCGAELYEEIKRILGFDYYERLIKGEVEEMELPRPWTKLSSEEIDRWAKRAYKEFYLRPSYILKRILKIESMDELKRYVKVGLKILFAL